MISISRISFLKAATTFKGFSRSLVPKFTSTFLSFNYSTAKQDLPKDLNSLKIIKTRNIGIIAHIDAGKTTTTERMLYYSGSIQSIGNVDQGDTITDYLPAERNRGITIQSAAVTFAWNKNKINLIDTPGHADFTFEVIRSLRVLDSAVVILDGVAGVEAQTEKVWNQSKYLNLPSIIFINKMDRMGAGFSRSCKEIIQKLKTKIVLVNIPYFVENTQTRERVFSGIIDVIEKNLLIWDINDDINGDKISVVDLLQTENQSKYPLAFEELLKSRESMIETLCDIEGNDKLFENFFNNDENYLNVDNKTLKNAIKFSTITNKVSPVLCGASFKNIGVQPLLDSVISYLPNPVETQYPEISFNLSNISKRKTTKKHSNKSNNAAEQKIPMKFDATKGLVVNNNQHLSLALAFKVITDDRKNIMIFIRVYAGTVLNGSVLLNSRTNKRFRIMKLLLINGNVTQEIDKLTCGNIGVIIASLISSVSADSQVESKHSISDVSTSDSLDNSNFGGLNNDNEIRTGDTLICHIFKKDGTKSFTELEQSLVLNPISIPPSIFISSIEPKSLKDKKILDNNLAIILREDPSLRVFYDDETGQMLLSGMGELHLEIVKDRLINDLKTNCKMSKVMVSYKESILNKSRTVNKIDDNNGHFVCEVSLLLEPISGLAKDHELYNKEGLFDLELDNNLIYVPLESAPQAARTFFNSTKESKEDSAEEMIWPYQIKYEQIIQSLYSSVISGLQRGGPIARLPLNSVLVRINKWNISKELSSWAPLLQVTRNAMVEAINCYSNETDLKKNYTLLEPIMKTQVFVNTEDLGKVIQDLTSVRRGEISSIEDDNESNNLNRKNPNAEPTYFSSSDELNKQFFPFDPTLTYASSGTKKEVLRDINGKQKINAEVPLREMIGYLSKLRSLTKGNGVFLMEYKGMKKVSSNEKINEILQQY
ncbi:mitochondrial elongation factor MEF2 [Ascoidea rubescens DSM 1968]|uniref:Ribosome-releasing factor 2, mitochondrial n=1 Tax=Ascoidea rubescens DSM 1968 TaxID=1344418 RepID=A0A1D2VR10_9ASCO|nr:P-loop containing nucleoside triphosphate hydrolase protein [Ascoidea rubescens DSM 1968]ODV64053.1 P-loop containing nucleoside triphosphate hydrolase protein [Ascoidea rubescens DSM 1968]